MRRPKIHVAILSMEGTNCDEELAVAFQAVGAQPEILPLRAFESDGARSGPRRRLDEFQLVLVPGGFSAGDYVRAGAIFAARLRTSLGDELEQYVSSGGYLGGICNGFQVLTELGLLPGRPNGRLGAPQAALMPNASGHFECRTTFLRWDGGNFAPLQNVPAGTVWRAPSAHGEGRLCLVGDSGERLRQLHAAGQLLFRWSDPTGGAAPYPWNPNGSPGDIAGLTNPEGNVFGFMPHPERAAFRWQYADWTRTGDSESLGDGQQLFGAIVQHLAERR
ncbi:MAG: phosphoribosylformylglycinamidine synthase I [Thermoplasmata archaeon]|nr:phosphoribosylformylglycinamidine synthase I [Thermoplasmata archaeon]